MEEPIDGTTDDVGSEADGESFGELLAYTVAGYAGGLLVAVILDWLGFKQSPVGQWIVRTLSGEGESIFEGLFAIRRRLSGAVASMAEAYGWGKLIGMIVPWIVDLVSRLAGVAVNEAEGFYIPYLYAMSDQIGATVMGLLYLHRQDKSWASAILRYFRSPVMVASFSLILIVPFGLLAGRLLGFRPSTQVYTAIETILANLCWIPPLIGWLTQRAKP